MKRKIACILALLVLAAATPISAGSLTYERMLQGWLHSVEHLEADTVFYGDSLTEGGDWESLFPEWDLVNFGVVGDTIDNLVYRMPLLTTLMPAEVFVLVGINDMIYGCIIEDMMTSYRELFDALAALSADIYVESLLPVRADRAESLGFDNADIQAVNRQLASLAADYGFAFID